MFVVAEERGKGQWRAVEEAKAGLDLYRHGDWAVVPRNKSDGKGLSRLTRITAGELQADEGAQNLHLHDRARHSIGDA